MSSVDQTRGFPYKPGMLNNNHDGPMRQGKTRRDKLSGAWMNRLANRDRRAEESKKLAGTLK